MKPDYKTNWSKGKQTSLREMHDILVFVFVLFLVYNTLSLTKKQEAAA